MFARYYAGRRSATDYVQRYRGSPHKARLDHVAASLVAQRYGEAVVAQHLREWVRFTIYVDAQGARSHRASTPPRCRPTWLSG
jgi:hypothetical protein